MILVPPKIDYKGTITGLRVSAVDGTAFIDNLPLTYSSDFSAGVDGWATATVGTADGNIDSIGGEDNWLRYTIDTSLSTKRLTSPAALVVGRKYTVSFQYYIPATNNIITSISLWDYLNTNLAVLSTVGSVTSGTVTFTASATNGIRFYALSSQQIQDAGGDDVFYIKDVTISEITPYMDGNHSIEIYDSAGRFIRGVLKAAGTSEGLGGETITGWTNSDFDNFTSSGTSITQMVSGAAGDNCYSNEVQTVGALYKIAFSASREEVILNFVNGTNQTLLDPYKTILYGVVSGANSAKYYTAVGTLSGFKGGAFSDTQISSFTHKQVLTPSALGATIVSAKAGTTYNFSYKNPSFTYNAENYYCIIKKIVGEVVVASGDITAGNALIDSTTANAFAAPVGVDLTAYQTGKYRLDLYSTATGVLWAQGFISATAPSSEDLGSELTPNNTAVSDSQTEGNATTGWTTVGYVPTTFESTSSGTPSAGTYHFHTVADVNTKGFYLVSSGTQGALYKFVFDIKVTSGTVRTTTYNGELSLHHTNASYETKTIYYNSYNSPSHYADMYIRSYSVGAEWYNDNMQLTRLNMPAATGCLLLSSYGGSRGFVFKHASFDPNVALSYKIVKVVD